MSGKGLQDLGLKEEKLPELTYDDMPDFGAFTPPPQPGKYRFKLPMDLSRVYDTFDANEKQHLQVIFDKDAPLQIMQAKDASLVGEPFQVRLNSMPRKRGDVEASDLDYLLKALGEKSKPTTLKGYAQKLGEHRGQEFTAEINYSWYCNDKKNIWAQDAQGKRQEVENQKGCGRKYYQADKTKKDEQKIQRLEDGTYPLEVACSCGALVRAFANLDNMTA